MLLVVTATVSSAVTKNDKTFDTRGWSEISKLVASDGSGDDRFGVSVALDGSDAIIGAYFDDPGGQSNAGSAYVFTYQSTTWVQQQKLTATDSATDDQFGFSVSICGDYAIVGAPFDDDSGASSGSAYVFTRTGTTWMQQAKLTAADAAAGDRFGQSVDIDGEYAIIGAPYKNSNQGFAYIFVRSGTTWTQQTKIGATVSTYLGASVSISGDTVVMGAFGTNSNTGMARVYERTGTSWYGKATLTASDGATGDNFGASVSIDGEYIVIGAPGDDQSSSNEGAMYLFEEPTTGWADSTETQKLSASDAESGDALGSQVSIAGGYAIGSTPYDDESGTYSGSAYLFKKTGSVWAQQAKLLASDGASNDYFGWSVSITGNTALISAYAEDNTNGIDAGSAYIFEYVNLPPDPPAITGPTSGKIKVATTYTFTTSDPEDDDLYFYVDWGDSTNSGWIGPDDTLELSHTWQKKGTYTIKAQAKDSLGALSNWTNYPITMPYSYNIPFKPLFERLFDRFPQLFPILRVLLGY